MIIITLIFALLGFLDATYLTILHYKNVIPPCSFHHSCETVLTSKFATIGPVPISLLGTLFYVSIMILVGLLLERNADRNQIKLRSSENQKLRKSDQSDTQSSIRVLSEHHLKQMLFLITASGIVVSAILVYIQAFILHAFCQYCLTSEGINLVLFILILLLQRRKT